MMTLPTSGFFTPIVIHMDINLCNDFNKSCTVEVVLYDFDTVLVGNKNSNDEEVNGYRIKSKDVLFDKDRSLSQKVIIEMVCSTGTAQL